MQLLNKKVLFSREANKSNPGNFCFSEIILLFFANRNNVCFLKKISKKKQEKYFSLFEKILKNLDKIFQFHGGSNNFAHIIIRLPECVFHERS